MFQLIEEGPLSPKGGQIWRSPLHQKVDKDIIIGQRYFVTAKLISCNLHIYEDQNGDIHKEGIQLFQRERDL